MLCGFTENVGYNRFGQLSFVSLYIVPLVKRVGHSWSSNVLIFIFHSLYLGFAASSHIYASFFYSNHISILCVVRVKVICLKAFSDRKGGTWSPM